MLDALATTICREGGENYQMLVRPLFITSFMCADFLEDNNFFGARQIVVASASSKTAYGTAYCLHGRADVKLIALTSARNRSFVDGLGCYDEVKSYAEAERIDAGAPTLYLDFSGDERLRATVHHHFGPVLIYDCYAGSAQSKEFLQKSPLPGPEPKLYFAPVQIKKRNQDWGHDEVNRRYNAAQQAFIERIGRPGSEWMTVVEHTGFEAAAALIERLHGGIADSRDGHVVLMP